MVVDVEIFSACPMVPGPTWVVIGERGMLQGGNPLTVQWVEEGALPPIEADPARRRGGGTAPVKRCPGKSQEIHPSRRVADCGGLREPVPFDPPRRTAHGHSRERAAAIGSARPLPLDLYPGMRGAGGADRHRRGRPDGS